MKGRAGSWHTEFVTNDALQGYAEVGVLCSKVLKHRLMLLVLKQYYSLGVTEQLTALCTVFVCSFDLCRSAGTMTTGGSTVSFASSSALTIPIIVPGGNNHNQGNTIWRVTEGTGEYSNCTGTLITIGRGDPFDPADDNTELYVVTILELDHMAPGSSLPISGAGQLSVPILIVILLIVSLL